MQQSSGAAGQQTCGKEDLPVAKLDNTQHGDEIIIIIRNGVVVKFEQRKINLENGNV
ncbi:hypothetical protein [Anaerosporomusa subterranea]|uniref:hypothetical protein n=1 Tax=Anaerosporomusa subterranea TaxID=1794912 RepID=UPI0012E73B28|nr:hypothetical protein [Anaerosporomusa subterranea]